MPILVYSYRNPDDSTASDEVTQDLDIHRVDVAVVVSYVAKRCPEVNVTKHFKFVIYKC